MHKYLDYNKVRDFTKKKTFRDIENDIINKYKITNIRDDDGESCYAICEVLYEDYRDKMSNYEAFIEEGMNLRLLMELRNSALIALAKDEAMDYYTGFNNLDTWQQVRDFRNSYIKSLNKYYRGYEWQLYMLLLFIWRNRANHIMICFEACYDDGDPNLQTSYEDYERDFIYVHSPQFDRDHPDMVDRF